MRQTREVSVFLTSIWLSEYDAVTTDEVFWDNYHNTVYTDWWI